MSKKISPPETVTTLNPKSHHCPKTLLKHRHTIKVVGYDDEGNYDSDEIKVWKFF